MALTRRQEQWDEYQRQQRTQQASMSDVPKGSPYQTLAISRKRADSHQPASISPRLHPLVEASQPDSLDSASDLAHLRSIQTYDEQPRRYSNADYGHVGNSLSPQRSPVHPQGGLRRLSENFNAPTYVELERDREHRRNSRGMEKLRNKVKEWVRA